MLTTGKAEAVVRIQYICMYLVLTLVTRAKQNKTNWATDFRDFIPR
jgi:hypothetical protein